MTTDTLKNKTIGQIVADDYRAAAIFKSAGIDFCCGGNKSLELACKRFYFPKNCAVWLAMKKM